MGILYFARRIHGKIDTVWQNQKKKLALKKNIRAHPSMKAFVYGTPSHSNIGDSAIVLAEMMFMQKCNIRQDECLELSYEETKDNLTLLSRLIRRMNVPVVFPGGGNMGDQWLGEEVYRRASLRAFEGQNLIVFPQTLFYSDSAEGREEQQKSISYYSNNDKLLLVARERTSYDLMNDLYPGTKIILTPDIVLSSTLEDYDTSETVRQGVLLCARSDKEKKTDNSLWENLEKHLRHEGKIPRYTDMYSDTPITKENRRDIVSKKMQEFRSAELVITDRLHGMVFSAIAGTPCVVFGNCNHKVKGTYDWISYLPYVRYVDTYDDALDAISDFKQYKNCQFSNAPLRPYFETLANEIIRVNNDLSNCPGI